MKMNEFDFADIIGRDSYCTAFFSSSALYSVPDRSLTSSVGIVDERKASRGCNREMEIQPKVFARKSLITAETSSTCVSRAKCPVSRN
jgi:hypothetical protein